MPIFDATNKNDLKEYLIVINTHDARFARFDFQKKRTHFLYKQIILFGAVNYPLNSKKCLQFILRPVQKLEIPMK